MQTLRLLLLVCALSLASTAAFQPAGSSDTHGVAVAFAAAPDDAPAAPPKIDVNINGGSEKHFISFDNPLVLGAAVVGVLLLVVLIAMAARGGGTTIIREK